MILPSFEELMTTTRTALVVIDVQNDFCSPEFPAHKQILSPLQKLISEARRAGVPLVYTQAVHNDKTDSAVWKSRYRLRPHRNQTCRIGTPGVDFHPTVRPAPEDIIVQKHRYSAFIGTDLELILRAQRIETLLFTGIATNVCVEAAARDAFQRDFWTIMVSDCMAAHSEEAHKAALTNCERGFGIVVTSDQIEKVWRGLAEAA
ncbi:MAG: cysteine hydrolase [Hyphomicrobiales bacterium]|nr:cysteine hydrolase [Hyphomicrobiales bacterium]